MHKLEKQFQLPELQSSQNSNEAIFSFKRCSSPIWIFVQVEMKKLNSIEFRKKNWREFQKTLDDYKNRWGNIDKMFSFSFHHVRAIT
jgi:hypothetical protein